MPTTRVEFDARPLTDTEDARGARDYAARLRESGALGTGAGTILSAIVFGIAVVVFLVILLPTIVGIAAGGRGSVAIVLIPIAVVAGAAAWFVIAQRMRRVRLWRLGRFAEANGMRYLPSESDPGLPGMIFSLGSSRQATDVLRAETPRETEYANYRYTTGSGKNRTTHRWGYVAIRLDVPLPNIVLDATSNNGIFGSNLPASFARGQRLSLEGDFDQHFALYCPEGYEQDALYLFTPDIMARFIDNAAALDVEIVDDRLFLYLKRDVVTLDPGTWEWLFSVVHAIDDKFAQWARWRDDRLAAAPAATPAAAPGSSPTAPALALLRPPPGVAQEGRRLKRGVSWITIVIVAVVGLYWILSSVSAFGR